MGKVALGAELENNLITLLRYLPASEKDICRGILGQVQACGAVSERDKERALEIWETYGHLAQRMKRNVVSERPTFILGE